MNRKRIYLCLAHMSGNEMKYIQDAFDTNWVVPLGPNVNGFEKDLESFVGQDKKVVALSAGTAAVHLALLDCDVKAGDEVMVQSFTFCASSNPVKYLGAKPVLVDSEKETWNMDPQLLDKAYMYDCPFCVVAGEGLGSRYKEQVCGTFGRYGVLSFNGNKMITTSGGGALICPDTESQSRIMFYATQARESYPYYQHQHIGYNYRLSNVCAGIGRGQMTVLNDHIAHHKHVHDLYTRLLANVKGITVHSNPTPDFDSNFWLNTILLDEGVKIKGEEKAYSQVITGAVGGAAGVTHSAKSAHTSLEPNKNVEALRIALDQASIEARPLWKPMHCQPVYADCTSYTNGISEDLFRKGLCLPSGPCVSEEDVRYITDTIKENIITK